VTGRRTATLIALALVLVAAVPEGQAKSGTPITACGQVVTTDAFLTGGLVCMGNGVVVGAAGITIDLKGFTIRGNRFPASHGVDDAGGFDDVAVKNGVLRNFGFGVYASGADSFVVANVLVSGNLNGGIWIVGGSPSIASVTAYGNAVDGITAFGGGLAIKSSTASGNANVGIDVVGAAASVKSSTASGNGSFGIAVGGNDASLKGNRADGNGFAGGASDLLGLGIEVTDFTTAPHGTNSARGNDNPEECDPFYLC